MEPFSEVFDDIAAWVRAPLGFEPRVESAGERTDIVDAVRLAGRVRLPQGATAALAAFSV